MRGVPSQDEALRTGRGLELALLVFAILTVTAADAIVDLNTTNSVGADVVTYGAGFTLLWLAAHIVVRVLAPYADPLLLPSAALLNGLGLVLIRRLDVAVIERARQSGDPIPRGDASVQIVWTGLGLALFTATLLIVRNHKALARYAYTLAFAGLTFLALPALLPARYSEVNGAKIWIKLFGFTIQPGEFAKLALMVFFAAYLVAKRDVLSLASRSVLGIDLPRGRDLGPVIMAWALSLLVLVGESDLGTSLLFFGIFVAMLYIATERTSWVLIGVLLFAGGAFLAYHTIPHVRVRFDYWLDPFGHRANATQILQALFGLATGGVLGTGLGNGHPEMVPFAKTDFIFAAIGEELGMFGLVAVLLVYAIIVERGFRTSLQVRDAFGKLLAAGLAFSLAWQVFVVVGGVTKLVPLTGLTSPFLSYGGSSLVANFALVGLLLRISDGARRPAPPPAAPPPPLAEAVTEVVTQ
ncbi:MAG: FtsW/RodA/SpoVE family cell cycle protein [Actinobacteria bacterium]|nr:FtsW/RodA/SpoVE family cell cycle protein [Actinomycetota bacterium]MBI3686253.1 FtsW/RodA/SpoVE family cell cycle protein [Actinomycetota bacterium]